MLDFAVSGANNQLDGLIVTSASAASAAAAAAAAAAADSTKPINGIGLGGGGGGGGEEGIAAGNSTGFMVVGSSNPVVSESAGDTVSIHPGSYRPGHLRVHYEYY